LGAGMDLKVTAVCLWPRRCRSRAWRTLEARVEMIEPDEGVLALTDGTESTKCEPIPGTQNHEQTAGDRP
jgi:hypothetical protein